MRNFRFFVTADSSVVNNLVNLKSVSSERFVYRAENLIALQISQ